ncbi:MAG: response regulator [Acidobacteria bacterium]|jgi:DNA-binding NtrC family response regulator|nr:response regulator [Acidobacteriota bacterium]
MKKIILLVENDQSSIEIIQKILHDKIFRITVAQSDEMARDLLKNTRFDLLITETQLPKSHGFILSKFVSERYPSVKIIIISEKLKQDEYKLEAITQHGAHEFFEKPLPDRAFRKKALDLMGIDDKKLMDISFSSEASTKQHVLPTLEELAAYRSKSKTGDSTPEPPKGKDNIPIIHIDLD